VTHRQVRLPLGAAWEDAWTQEQFAGGTVIDRPAPYARPPFFLRLDPPSGLAARPIVL
jgi:alpha-glucosidase (family GH31 glycosyl hydrolase)